MISKYPGRSAIFLTLGLVALVGSTVVAQRKTRDSSEFGRTAQLVSRLVSQKHISRAPINDDVSRRLTKRYIESLDPQKLYFTKADVATLSQKMTTLDDELRNGDASFAFEGFNLYLKRLQERIQTAQKLIDTEHDFTVDESMIIDPDDLAWATTDAEITERWRKRIKLDLLSLKLDKTEMPEARERLHKRYNTISQTMMQTEEIEKLEMYLSSLTHTMDPHSTYMSPQTLEDFRISMELKLEGIGAALRSEDGYTVVADVVSGGAADEDGRLKVGDKIVAVDSRSNDEWTDVVEMKLSKVVRYIRGPKGTKVRLEVKTPEKDESVIYELKRKTIELKSAEVKGEVIDVGQRIDGRTGRVGVISLPSFYRDFRGASLGLPDFKSARRDVEKVLQQFASGPKLDAVIVDLRFNGGGALVEAVELSGLFVSKGPIVQTKEQDGQIKPHIDDDPSVWYQGPLVVVCNRLSASASEIFAGAIKDWGRGIVIGDTTTHGKGTVQNVMPVSARMQLFGGDQDRGAIKLTIQQFYRVNGDSTQVNGVRSDVVLPSILDHREVGEESLDNALPFDHINAAITPMNAMRSPNLMTALAQRSAKRVAADEEFQDVESDIKRVIERQTRKTISLNEAVLRKERDEAKKGDEDEEDKEEEDKDKKKEDPPVFPDTFYNDEVLNITLDYVGLLKSVKTAGTGK